MATFTYNTNSFFDLNAVATQWNGYTVSGTGNTITLTTSSVPAGGAGKVVLTYSGRTVEEGSEPGQPSLITTAGTLTGVSFFAAAADATPLLAVTGLSISALYFDSIRAAGRGDLAVESLLTASTNTVNGTALADSISTFAGADRVLAGAGDDVIYDFGGRDTYDGGTGFDVVSYEGHWLIPSFTRGITVNLSTNKVSANGQTDTLVGIEQVIGSHRSDSFLGSAAADRFFGMGGNDNFRGGAGIDTLDYSRDDDGLYGAFRGITANLTAGTVRDGFGGRDTTKDVENVVGTDYRDTITGNAAANVLTGNGGRDTMNGAAGADTINGGAGNDTINGGDGNDALTGGSDADVFMFRDTAATTGLNIGTDTIADFANGVDRIDLVGLADAFADITATASGSNTVLTIAGVTGSITLTGFTAANVDATDFIFG